MTKGSEQVYVKCPLSDNCPLLRDIPNCGHRVKHIKMDNSSVNFCEGGTPPECPACIPVEPIECIHSIGRNWNCNVNAEYLCPRNKYTQSLCPHYLPSPVNQAEQGVCKRCNGDKRGSNSPIGFLFPCPICKGTGKEPVKSNEGVEVRKILNSICCYCVECKICCYNKPGEYCKRISQLRQSIAREVVGEVEKIVNDVRYTNNLSSRFQNFKDELKQKLKEIIK